jgi:hypothetical protein
LRSPSSDRRCCPVLHVVRMSDHRKASLPILRKRLERHVRTLSV